jgi:ABC-type transport system involved in multi-copper enzyme maturation permease subunit
MQFLPAITPDDRLKLVQVVSSKAATFFAIVVGIFLAAASIPADIEDKTIYSVLTKPVSRWAYILGKTVGLILVTGAILLVMSLISYGVVRFVALQAAPKGLKEPLMAKMPVYASSLTYRSEERGISQMPVGEMVGLTGPRKMEAQWQWEGIKTSAFPPEEITLQGKFLVEGKVVGGRMRFVAINPASGERAEVFVNPKPYENFTVSFPASILGSGGTLKVIASAEEPDIYFGVTLRDLFLLKKPGSFTINFLKSIVLIFLQLLVMVPVAVVGSSFLSAPVSIIFAFFIYFCSNIVELMRGLAHSLTEPGTGVLGVNGIGHVHGPVEIPEQTLIVKIINTIVKYFIYGISYALPDFSKFAPANFLADKVNIPLKTILLLLAYALLYAAILSGISFYVFRRREIGK